MELYLAVNKHGFHSVVAFHVEPFLLLNAK